jgi:hypothetical protein
MQFYLEVWNVYTAVVWFNAKDENTLKAGMAGLMLKDTTTIAALPDPYIRVGILMLCHWCVEGHDW